MNSIVNTRVYWREEFKRGNIHINYLEIYRENRENPYWRSSSQVERLCEYILYLEDKLNNSSILDGFEDVVDRCS